MIKRYTTRSKSVYTIDFDNKTWKRERGKKASEIRSDSGTFESIKIVEGNDYWDGITLVCPPFDPENPVPRIITSTNIIKVEDIVGD